MNIAERIYGLFLDGTLANKNITEICKSLSVPYRERNRLLPILGELCDEGKLYKTENGKYGTSEQLGLIKGVISGNERGFGFLVPIDKTQYPNDFFIPRKYLRGAFHGDTVLAEQISWISDSDSEREEAKVVKVLQRGYQTIVGVFRKDKRAGYLYPDEKKFSAPIYIPLSNCSRIKNGVKAVAKITEYPYGKAPGGEIIEILGDEEDFFAEELSIIRSYNLREEFPPHVEKEAQKQEKRGITKAGRVGKLKELVERDKGRKMTLIACGDYENDIEMLRAADISVCPENAIPEVKEISDLCLCHCDKGLIADVVRKLDSNEELRKGILS